MDKITIIPRGGLCNRFRFLFSYIYKMKKEDTFNNKKLVVIWETNSHCNGFLWDIIKPMPNCWTLKNNNKNFKIISASCGACLSI